jgi:hypothetical protein
MSDKCKWCQDTGLTVTLPSGPDVGSTYAVCACCESGSRLAVVLMAIAQRLPVALNGVDDRRFYATTCAYLDPMLEAASYTNGNYYGPKRET